MNTSISLETKQEIIRHYLYGLTTPENGTKTGVSIGTVSNVIGSLKMELGEKEVQAIRDFSVALKKLGITASQAFTGAKIFSVISKSDLDEDELQGLITYTIEYAKSHEISLSDLIQNSKKILELQQKSDIPLGDVPAKYQELLEEKESIKEEILDLSNKKQSAEQNIKKALDKNDLTEKTIQDFVYVKTELEKHNLGLGDMEKLVTVLKNSSDANYDTDKIIGHLQKEETHESRIKTFEQRDEKIQTQINGKTAELENITNKVKEKNSIAKQIKNLDEIGVKEHDLHTFYQTIKSIAKRHSIGTIDALKILCVDLEKNYDIKLGLKIHLEKLQGDISLKTQQLQSIQKQESDLRAKYDDELEALQALKHLQKHGIDVDKIQKWGEIFASSKLDVAEFSKKIRKKGDLEKVIAASEQKITSLQKDITKKESRKKWLEDNLDSLESRLELVEKIVKDNLEGLLDDIKEQVKLTQVQSTKIIDEVGAKAYKNLETCHKKSSDWLSETCASLDEFVSKSLKETKKIGRLEWLLELDDFLMGKNTDLPTYGPMINMILEKLVDCIKRYNFDSSSLESDIQKLIRRIKDIMNQNE